MFKLTLSPYAPLPGAYQPLQVSVQGDVLTINGEDYDLSPLPEGGELPSEAIPGEVFAGPIKREGGMIEVALRFPVAPVASEAARFPEPIIVTNDGPVEMPQ